ncbi:MAG: hypothetical protein ACRENF_08115, partial [Thermodesulfobacteriota bacterium]
MTDWAKIARDQDVVDVFQVPKRNPEFEKYRALKFTQDELNGPFVTMDEAIASSAAKSTFDSKKTLAASFEVELIKDQRLAILDSVRDLIRKGDTETADLLLGRHVEVAKLSSIAERAKNDLASMGEEGSVFGQILRQYGKNPETAQAQLHGTLEDLTEQGVGYHYPEWKRVPDRQKSKVLTSVKFANKEDGLHQLLLHEYGHDVDEFLKSAADLGDERAKTVLAALDEARAVHDHRMWDPVAEGIADIRGVKWPKSVHERVATPPGWDGEHHFLPKEGKADILALLATPKGRESLNPEVRNVLEPFFGRKKEPYTPKWRVPDEQAAKYYDPEGLPGVKQVNTVKNAGKILTTPAEEAQIHLATVNAATDPNTGTTSLPSQQLIKDLGPVASHGANSLLEGAGPFSKSKMLDGIDGIPEKAKVTLKDFFMAFKTLRASALLTGMGTHLANALSNTVRAVEQPGITLGAAIADVAKVATGAQAERKAFFGEALAQVQGQLSEAFGVHSALPAALRQFAHEIRSSKEYVGEASILQNLSAAIPNKSLSKASSVVSRLVEAPFTALRAVDTYFFDVNFAGSIYKQAYAKGINEGKGFNQALDEVIEQVGKFGKEAEEIQKSAIEGARIQEFGVNDPELEFIGQNKERIQQLVKEHMVAQAPADLASAKLAAERSIFVAREEKQLDNFLDSLDKWDAETYGAVSVVLPFRRTPAYIVREGIRSSPLGFIPILAQSLGKDPAKVLGTREMSQLMGQALFGTAAFYTLSQLVSAGHIKGDPAGFDPNKAHRDTYAAAGRKPGSLYIKAFGKTYTFPLDRIQPLGGS